MVHEYEAVFRIGRLGSFFLSSGRGGGGRMNDSKNEAGLRIVGVQGVSSSLLEWGNERSPGPLRGCMKNREAVVSPLSLWGGVMKDPENEAVCGIGSLWSFPYPLWGGVMKDPENNAVFRIVIVGSVSFKSGMEYYNTMKMMLHLG